MGLLSSIVGKIKSVASDIKTVYKGGEVSANQGKVATGIINAAATIGQSFNPFSNLKPSVNTNIVKSPTLQAAGNFLVKNPYTSAAVVAAPFTGAAKTIAKTATSTLTRKIAAGGIAAAVIPAAVTSSKVRTGLINTASTITPESLISTSANVGQLIEEPSGKTIGDVLKENKGTLLTLGAAATLFTGAKLAAPVIANALLDDKQPTQTQQQGYLVTDKSADIKSAASPIPITPQTQTLASSQTDKRSKSKRRATPPPLRVSQKVNVVVSQQQNKRYINKVSVLN